ncbi:MAG: hypothetical protein MZU95_02930 [Desulfomicrobium escambiense]|nr:hypothetical protein [Desulfomicrobium escambiense]
MARRMPRVSQSRGAGTTHRVSWPSEHPGGRLPVRPGQPHPRSVRPAAERPDTRFAAP